MKFLSVRDLRSKSAQVWRDLELEKEMVVTSNGRPIAMLAAIDEDSLEEALRGWRQTKATQALTKLQRDSVKKGTDALTMDEIDAEIQALRAERRAGS